MSSLDRLGDPELKRMDSRGGELVISRLGLLGSVPGQGKGRSSEAPGGSLRSPTRNEVGPGSGRQRQESVAEWSGQSEACQAWHLAPEPLRAPVLAPGLGHLAPSRGRQRVTPHLQVRKVALASSFRTPLAAGPGDRCKNPLVPVSRALKSPSCSLGPKVEAPAKCLTGQGRMGRGGFRQPSSREPRPPYCSQTAPSNAHTGAKQGRQVAYWKTHGDSGLLGGDQRAAAVCSLRTRMCPCTCTQTHSTRMYTHTDTAEQTPASTRLWASCPRVPRRSGL